MKKFLLFLAVLIVPALMNAQCTGSFSYWADTASNGNVYFHDTLSPAYAPTFSWDFGDGNYGWGSNPVHNYNGSGSFYVCMTAQDSASGCSITQCDTVHVSNLSPFCNANFFVGNLDSMGYTMIFDNSTGYMLTDAWDFGDGTTSTTSGVQLHIYPGPGVYPVCLTVTNADATCTSTYCDTIIISSCHANYSYTFDTFGNGCSFTSSVTGSPDTYFWNFGDGDTSTLANPYHVFPYNGYFYVTFSTTSSTDSTCSSSHSEYIYAGGLCNASFYISQDSTNPMNYLIHNYVYGNPMASYLWDFGDGTTSTTQYPTHTYADTLSYYICLTVSDPSGCNDTYCDTINAGRSAGGITMTVVPPPLGTGIAQHAETDYSLENFPNPFNEITTVKFSLSADAQVEVVVTDLLGNTVATLESGRRTAGSYTTGWSASGLAPGMYLLRMKTDNHILTKKMILTK